MPFGSNRYKDRKNYLGCSNIYGKHRTKVFNETLIKQFCFGEKKKGMERKIEGRWPEERRRNGGKTGKWRKGGKI